VEKRGEKPTTHRVRDLALTCSDLHRTAPSGEAKCVVTIPAAIVFLNENFKVGGKSSRANDRDGTICAAEKVRTADVKVSDPLRLVDVVCRFLLCD
jgi:hypothetical protein